MSEGSPAPPDLVAELTGLATALRRAGVDVPAGGVAATVTALAALGAPERHATYWAGRVTLCQRPDDLRVYDEVFDLWFSRAEWAGDVRRTVTVPTYRDVPVPGEADAGDPAAATAPPTSSEVEVLRCRDVAALDPDEKELVAHLVTRLAHRPALRRSRRTRSAAHGRVDLRRVVRDAVRTGGDPVRWSHRRPRVRPRRTVLLLDVSGSMSRYAETYLLFAHALVRSQPSAEVFSVGTRLTCLTRAFRSPDPQSSTEEVARRVVDWSGGTRLGEGLQWFLDRWGQRGTARGAVVVVFSDGWERGDARLLGEQMERLHRLAHRVVWVNPNRARPGYEPRTAGLRAALPHVDAFVDGHSVEALEALVDEIASGGRGRAPAPVLVPTPGGHRA
ncbi:vWA domain-containing protein [Nocardioides sp. CPCC 205120]|uniref:vWA domain-containing protein n=1 Tax=Nocardioides sp. CPCC 205120 TaxID=3406462 RepID=UPI003B501415